MKARPEEIKRIFKTARGQIDGILRMIEEDKYCVDISHQILACMALLKKANSEILRAHIRSCVKEAFESEREEEREEKINELMSIFEKQ